MKSTNVVEQPKDVRGEGTEYANGKGDVAKGPSRFLGPMTSQTPPIVFRKHKSAVRNHVMFIMLFTLL